MKNKGRVITEGIFNSRSHPKKNLKQITAPRPFCLGSKSEGQRFSSVFWNQIENTEIVPPVGPDIFITESNQSDLLTYHCF